ncbi:MAG: DNA/RNA non-specific endonuclease [Chitinophagales bacterium]|nr:DNA/RNA non-specific endonuclease [Chitinophagales bacterium]
MAINNTNTKNSKTSKSGLKPLFRFIMLVIGLLVLGITTYFYQERLPNQPFVEVSTTTDAKTKVKYNYLPSSTGEVINHTYYSLSYKEVHEQPEWVAYILTKKSLQKKPKAKREKDFVPDVLVTTYSATADDYRGSGYTRGHLVPAGDMAFDSTAMRETFLMSNMSPQLRQLNNGIWRELEENVRDWAYKADSLYVISGPILKHPIKTIGRKNKVTVPSAFYKVLLDNKGPEKKAIGFIIPHELSEKSLETYMVSVSDVEALTGLKFFEQMPNSEEMVRLKSNYEAKQWPVDKKRYDLRIKKWNYE